MYIFHSHCCKKEKGNKEGIHSHAVLYLLQSKLQQTYERFQYVRDEPLSKTCIKQIEEGNQLLPACRNVTAQANLLDKYSLTVTYQNVSEVV